MSLAERFDLLECLYEGRSVLVHRARDRRDGSTVILKTLRMGSASSSRLAHEYSILQQLAVPGVIRTLGMEEQGGDVALVLEDRGGETLAARLTRGPVPLPEALRLAVELADALGRIHQRRVIHKDINPNNLLIDAGGQGMVFDFDLATRLPREIQGVTTPNQLVGTLLFISPEQTGRMNRAIDYRTDLYSFGATLYAMVVGAVPFATSDPLELIHSHIARVPVAPADADPRIPRVLSDILMRLLAKAAEQRYQSAFGLKADLEECLRRLTPEGAIGPFPLGREDISDQFQIPQKLYGREREVAAIEEAFNRVRQGTAEMLIVSGSSGIGKSSVIHEVYKYLSQTRGYFISGKFDQLQRDVPYSALLQALTELFRSLLIESEEQLAAMRKLILVALRGMGRVLTDVLPVLAHVIGAQPPVQDLSGAEAGNRFRLIFQALIQVFTRHGQPLVIFLDDLHWADAATMDLITSLLSSADVGRLLVIGAYRDNEVSPEHSLLSTLAKIEKAGCRVTRRSIGPIEVEDVQQLCADTLLLDPAEVRPLAELLRQRTSGNPLFVGEMLTMFHRNGLLELDPAHRRWTFAFERIERAPSTENVGQLMAARAAALGEQAQEVLRLAAVVGNRFDVETLSIVAQKSPEQVTADLEEAVREGLILCIKQGQRSSHKFLHDRVQHVVYASIPEDTRLDLHHRTGRLLLANRRGEEHDGWLFALLHHLNLAGSRVGDPQERLSLVRMNQTAVKRAAASGAFATAVHYAAAGIGFLPEDAWESAHELMFALCLAQAEYEYLSGGHAAAEQLFERLKENAQGRKERVHVYGLMARYNEHHAQYRKALDLEFAALETLGIKLDPAPTFARILLDLAATKLALRGKRPDELESYPEAKDQGMQSALQLLCEAAGTAYFVDQLLFTSLSLKIVRVSMEHGYSVTTAAGFVAYAVVLATLGDHEASGAYGRLALRLTERFPDKRVETQIRFVYGLMILPWRVAAAECMPYAEEGAQCGIMSGQLVYAGYCIEASTLFLMSSGRPLDEVDQVCKPRLEMLRAIKFEGGEMVVSTVQQAVLALQGRTLSVGSYDTEELSEAALVRRLTDIDTKVWLHVYYVYKVMVLCILDRREEALAIVRATEEKAAEVLGLQTPTVDYYFYNAIVHIGVAEKKTGLALQRELLLIKGRLRKLKKWADAAPMNFRPRYLLVSAELARLSKDDHEAIKRYEEGIKLAHEHGILHEEAFGLELASRFYRSRGLDDVAVLYLARARRAYARWGAHAKVALLDQAYPDLVGVTATEPAAVGRTPTYDTMRSSTVSTDTFDAPSMVKASQALSGEISPSKLMLRLMSIVAESAGAERGSLILKHQGELVVVAEFDTQSGGGLPESPVPIAVSPSLSSGIVMYVFRTRESVILKNAAAEGSFTGDAYVVARKPKSILCAPLLQHGELKGALYLENNLVSGVFSQERAELLFVLCAQMAISIDNANLYADLEHKVIERTRELREAQARVIQLEKEATELQMAGGFAHEIRNALTSASLLVENVYDAERQGEPWSAPMANTADLSALFLLVREHVSQAPLMQVTSIMKELSSREQQVHAALRVVNRSLKRGLAITSMVLEYAQIGKNVRGSATVRLRPLVTSILEELAEGLVEKKITVNLDIPEDCAVVGYPTHFDVILKNLILNARDAMASVGDDNARVLEVRAVESLDGIVVSVRDTGVGISPELREKIFDPFFSTKPSTGIGLGLGMVRKFASLYDGTIDIESTPGQGSTFRVNFPRPTVPWVVATVAEA